MFDKKRNNIPINQTIAKAIEYYHVAVHHRAKPNTITLQLKWDPPVIGYYKPNIDGAATTNTRLGGIGGIFRIIGQIWYWFI